MFLKDVKITESKKFKKINSMLKSSYGVSISESASVEELEKLKESVVKSIINNRINNISASSPEHAKCILMKEGIDTLLEMHRSVDGRVDSASYNNVLSTLFKDAVNLLKQGDDIDDAMRSTLNSYRSSSYRFKDDDIALDLRARLEHYLNSNSDDTMLTDSYDWSTVSQSQRDAANELLKQKGSKLADLELEPYGDRADFERHGREIYKHPSLTKGISVKESRKLNENEVEQAEVVIAAKGFGQELQTMVEKLGRLMNEDLGAVSDQMRQTYGAATANRFQSELLADFNSIVDTLRSTKDRIDNAVDMLSTGSTYTDMDGIETAGTDVDMDDQLEIGDDLGLGIEDNFGAADTEEPLGRSMKESNSTRSNKLKKLSESLVSLQASIDKLKSSRKQ